MTRTKINGTIKNVKETSVIPVFASLLLIITVAVPVSVVSVLISSVWRVETGRHAEMQLWMKLYKVYCACSNVLQCTVLCMQHEVQYRSVLYMQHAVLY